MVGIFLGHIGVAQQYPLKQDIDIALTDHDLKFNKLQSFFVAARGEGSDILFSSGNDGHLNFQPLSSIALEKLYTKGKLFTQLKMITEYDSLQ